MTTWNKQTSSVFIRSSDEDNRIKNSSRARLFLWMKCRHIAIRMTRDIRGEF